jgi:hypothetical protein
MFKSVATAAILGMVSCHRLAVSDVSDVLGRNVDHYVHQDTKHSGYNGADEDEIYDNIFSKFSKEGLTPSGHKTGQKLLMKDDAKLASGQSLEAAHWLSPAEVPSYLDANFENAWNHYDQNGEGWIRYEETHVFFRYLLGKLNRFTGAPGSISDLSSGGKAYKLHYSTTTREKTPVSAV